MIVNFFNLNFGNGMKKVGSFVPYFLQWNKRVKFFVDTILKSNELSIKFFEMCKDAQSQLGHLMSYDFENS
jgi:hypothetical protein